MGIFVVTFVADKASICHSFIGELSFEIYAAKKKALKFKKELSFETWVYSVKVIINLMSYVVFASVKDSVIVKRKNMKQWKRGRRERRRLVESKVF